MFALNYWNAEIEYLFDLQGFVVFKDYFSESQINRWLKHLVYLENARSLQRPLVYGKERTASKIYISNIAEACPEFTDLIRDPAIVEVVENTTSGYFRFNHSYSISHGSNEFTHLHMGGAPLHPRAIYTTQSGRITSTLTKALIPLANHSVEDGCFCVVPGSHKSEFEYGHSFNLLPPEKHPSCVPLAANPGDLVIFTEALQHGGLMNVSGRMRRSLFYCYSLGSVVDWGGALNLYCSESLLNHHNEEIRQIVKIKGRF